MGSVSSHRISLRTDKDSVVGLDVTKCIVTGDRRQIGNRSPGVALVLPPPPLAVKPLETPVRTDKLRQARSQNLIAPVDPFKPALNPFNRRLRPRSWLFRTHTLTSSVRTGTSPPNTPTHRLTAINSSVATLTM